MVTRSVSSYLLGIPYLIANFPFFLQLCGLENVAIIYTVVLPENSLHSGLPVVHMLSSPLIAIIFSYHTFKCHVDPYFGTKAEDIATLDQEEMKFYDSIRLKLF
jgi:hypothetical protein